MVFGRKGSSDAAGTAVAEASPEVVEARELAQRGNVDEAIGLLTDRNKAERGLELEREIRRLRHLAGIQLLSDSPKSPEYAEPGGEVPEPGAQSRIPEVSPDQLTPALLRASILQYGCLLVRGLMDRDAAERMASGIDRAFEVRERLAAGESDRDGYYDELEAEPPFVIEGRAWVQEGGGVLAADSPRLLFDMIESFRAAGLESLISGYLGERPAISAQKCTLRKAMPEVGGAWHQDGRFLGDVRSLNVWLSLSRCGDVAPSMDVIPRRLDDYAPAGTEGTVLPYQVAQDVAERVAGEAGIVRPIFDPGDALLFDHLFLHQTGSDPSMPNPRYAVESWFFGPSGFPTEYVPIAF
jgi:hypothetical protein